jgi:uroporphyrinogen-III decarboxylase
MDWAETAHRLSTARAEGRLAAASLPHGHTFLLLQSLRGYSNLVYDMADGEPRLHELIGIIESFNLALVHRCLTLGAEWMGYPEDLGMQRGPMISPAHFARYIKPVYQRLMQPAREAGCIVHMHSDGDIRALADDLIEGGVEVINLQDLVNGIDWIADRFAGRVCIDLDIDRQTVTRFGTPDQIDALIREEVARLGRVEGGLMMVFGLYPGTPLRNVGALMDAMERYATYYA